MAQVRENGSVLSDQFLTGVLNHYVVDVTAAGGNADVVGYTYDAGTGENTANPGEELLLLVSSLVNPVIWEISDANTVFFAAEVDGILATDLTTTINASDSFTGVVVTAGTYTVV